ncbi:MAG: hypothetical protein NVSMB17_03710 [Candidatus Dormibacteria bacterium]
MGVTSSVAWVVLGLGRGSSVPGLRPFSSQNIEFALSGALIAAVALLIAIRRPDNRTWIPLALLATGNLQGALAEYGILAVLRQPHTYPGGDVTVWLSSWMFAIFLAAFGAVLHIFPTGRPLPGRWRWALWAAPASSAIYAVALAITPGFRQNYPSGAPGPIHNPLGLTGIGTLLAVMSGVATAGFVVTTVGGLAALVTRFRRGTPDERQQLKPFLLVGSFGIFGVLQGTNLFPAGSPGWWLGFVSTSVVLPFGLPLAIGVAILRYRLYDLDIVIRRTFIYGALAAFITAVYVGVVAGIGSLVGSAGRANVFLSVVATAIIAVAFQPAQQRLQRVANRIAYGRRATPYEVLAELSSRAGESYAADEVLPRMARALAEGTGAARAAVWVRTGDMLHEAASWPPSTPRDPLPLPAGQLMPKVDGPQRMVPVRHQGELLGALAVASMTGEALRPVEARLLDDLAGHAGLVLKNFGLTAELRARLEDLHASRSRLVAAQDGERRRIERDLHDGAQQNLVALKVKVSLVERFVDRDPARVKAMLAEVKEEVGEALENLRDLAHGIYPPLLADQGLVVALQSQARKATVPVEVVAAAVARYPAEVEAAVYFCVLEALQNVQKYAHAKTVVVRLEGSDRAITFDVEDDGQGFDPGARPRGNGLTNMADRLEALGGSVVVRSSPGRGTTVSGSAPVRTAVAGVLEPA